MPRPLTDAERRQRQTVADRVRFLLENRWEGNQNQMARDLEVSQSNVSKIARGERVPGRKFMLVLSRFPGVNPDWVLRGEGQPFTATSKGMLPIARCILPGWPEQCLELLTGEHHPIAEALERTSRYWSALSAGSLLVEQADLALLPGDLLLCEADQRVWAKQLTRFSGNLFGVKLQRGTTLCYEMGLLREEDNRLIIDLFGEVVRVLDAALPAGSVQGKKKANPFRTPRRRTIRFVIEDAAEPGGEPRLVPVKRPRSPSTPTDNEAPGLVCTPVDLVALVIYMVRPWGNHANLSS